MIPKYVTNEVIRLKAIKKGMEANPGRWIGQSIGLLQIEEAIAALEQKGDEIDTADADLRKVQATGHPLVAAKAAIADQAVALAKALHMEEPEKLNDYNIAKPKTNQSALPIPGKAFIESISDDSDGEGFIISVQFLANATDYEIWRGVSATPNLEALEPITFAYLKATKKLAYTDNEVEKGKRYFYRVRGYNRRGRGEWSAPVSRVQ